MKRLVIIGRTGQVASELRRLALPSGWSMFALDRTSLDLCNPGTFAGVLLPLEPAAIINAAAYTAVDKAETESELAFRVNCDAPAELARIAADQDVPFLHVSTDYVFNGTTATPWKEEDDTAPINIYGASKLAGEHAIEEKGARWLVLRTSWVFSSFGNNFVKTMLRLAQERPELSIIADQRGGPTPAADIAATLLKIAVDLASNTNSATGLYHYSGQPETTWADFAEAVLSGTRWLERKPIVHRITADQYRTAAKRPMYSVLDCTKIQRDHGIHQPDWRQGLSIVLDEIGNQTFTGAWH